MKSKNPFWLTIMEADVLVDRLREYCTRIEIAGSIRRKRPEIGDIELVAIPKFLPDMFDQPNYGGDHALDLVDWSMFGTMIKGGHKLKQIELHSGINLDLFIVTPPASWGIIFLLRTGSEDWGRQFVTKRSEGGLLPSNMEVKHGALWLNGHLVDTPEEADVFKATGHPYVEPELREV